MAEKGVHPATMVYPLAWLNEGYTLKSSLGRGVYFWSITIPDVKYGHKRELLCKQEVRRRERDSFNTASNKLKGNQMELSEVGVITQLRM